jgi:hypothetical protein
MTKSSNVSNKKSDFSKMLELQPVSYYWLGFLLADGHFSKNSIKLTLSCQDRGQIEKFAEFINVKVYEDKPRMSEYGLTKSVTATGYDSKSVPIIRNKFGISSRKTYIPPNLKELALDDISLLSLIIGIIDGDGSIGKTRKRITLEAHISWLPNLQFIYEFIYRYTRNLYSCNSFISSKGNAYLSIGKTEILSNLKYFIDQYNLPVLDRKWSHIDPIPFRRDHVISSKYASKCSPIIVDGLSFGSLSEASRYFNCNQDTIVRYLTKTSFDGASQ